MLPKVMAERPALIAARRLHLTSLSIRRFLSSSLSASPQALPTRPSIAPKPTLDIKSIRQNPELYAQNCLERNYTKQSSYPAQIVKHFNEWKDLQYTARSLRERSNALRTRLTHTKTFSGRDEADQHDSVVGNEGIIAEARDLKEQLTIIEEQEDDLQNKIEALAIELPNLTSTQTPVGAQPKVLEFINSHPDPYKRNKDVVSHVQIGSELDLLDFSAAAATSGWGWYYLKNEAALLEQVLVQYALNVANKHGFTIIAPPSIVYSHIAAACGFRPRDTGGEQQIYDIAQPASDEGKPELSLAGTAEIPFAAMRANAEMEEAELPQRVVGSSRCYRAEAGSRGVDTKGLYRVHEFTKVEMFGWTAPTEEAATALFDSMIAIQKEILTALGLHCRVLEQPTTDLGASATRKVDIEAFFLSRRERNDGWGEVTSVSICSDYQTRRLATRVRTAKGGKLAYPWTVNGTAIAIPRVLAALLENGWDESEGGVHVPDVLKGYLGGLEVIRRTKY